MRRKIIPNIVDTLFCSNAQGQHTHSAWTQITATGHFRLPSWLFPTSSFPSVHSESHAKTSLWPAAWPGAWPPSSPPPPPLFPPVSLFLFGRAAWTRLYSSTLSQGPMRGKFTGHKLSNWLWQVYSCSCLPSCIIANERASWQSAWLSLVPFCVQYCTAAEVPNVFRGNPHWTVKWGFYALMSFKSVLDHGNLKKITNYLNFSLFQINIPKWRSPIPRRLRRCWILR